MLKLIWYLLFGRACAHAWGVVTDRDFAPPILEVRKSGVYPGEANLHVEACRATYFAVVACTRCGALRTFCHRA